MSSDTLRVGSVRRRGGLVLLVGVLALTTAGSALLSPTRVAVAASATTTTDLNLRAGPSTGDAVLLTMPPGTAVELTGQQANGFVGVMVNGVSGWAYAGYLSTGAAPPAPPAPGPSTDGATGSAMVSGPLNLRSGPSTADPIVLVMPGGSVVALDGRASNGFVGVSFNGVSGWAFAAYLGVTGAPVTTPPPTVDLGPPPATTPPPGPTGSGSTGAATTMSALNLRSGPGTEYPVLTTMPSGSAVTRTGPVQGEFAQVTFLGQEGWASTAFLQEGSAPSPDPAPAPTPSPTPDPPPAPTGSGSTTDQIIQIIYEAADRYGQPREDMLRVAQCESNLIPTAVNVAGGSYGLFQFLEGTWATTPYAGYDIFDPWASANAAGWMWQQGRRNEWVCQ